MVRVSEVVADIVPVMVSDPVALRVVVMVGKEYETLRVSELSTVTVRLIVKEGKVIVNEGEGFVIDNDPERESLNDMVPVCEIVVLKLVDRVRD